jgi:hypothetical protein
MSCSWVRKSPFLAVFLAVSLLPAGQGATLVLRNGKSAKPNPVQLSGQNGEYELRVDSDPKRDAMFDPLPAGVEATLQCPESDPRGLFSGTAFAILKNCTITIVGPESLSSLRLKILGPGRPEEVTVKLTALPPAVPPPAAVAGPSPTADAGPSSVGHPTYAGSLSRWIIGGLAAVLVILVIIRYRILRVDRKGSRPAVARVGPAQRPAAISVDDNIPLEHTAADNLARRLDAAVPARRESPESQIAALQSECEAVLKRALRLETGLDGLTRDMQAQLERVVATTREEVTEIVRRGTAASAQREARASAELADLSQRLGALEVQIEKARQGTEKGVRSLLEPLVLRTVLERSTTTIDSGPQMAEAIEKAVTKYLAGDPLSRASIEDFSRRAEQLQSALDGFQETAETTTQGPASGRLGPLTRDLGQVRQELAGLLSSGDGQVRLSFAVDFSTHEAARQTLSEALVAGLQREIVKLDDPEDYYEKRLTLLASRVAIEAADLADTSLDPDRRNGTVQAALEAVFAAAGVNQIAPRRNDLFEGREHHMLQMTRRTSASDRSGAVAQLVARGLRSGDRVIRRASVILFD